MAYNMELKQIQKYVQSHNISKINFVSKITAMIFSVLLIADIIYLFIQPDTTSIRAELLPYFTLLLLNSVWVYLTSSKRSMLERINIKQIDVTVLYVTLLLLAGVFISLADTSMYNHLMIYTLLVVVSGGHFALRPKQFMVPLFIATFILLAGLYWHNGVTLVFQNQLFFLLVLLPIVLYLSNHHYMNYVQSIHTQLHLMNEVETKQKLAKELAILNKQLEMQASLDSLTQLYNRHAMNEYFEELSERTKNESFELSVIVIDVDYFKQYNDLYGHVAGDEVLMKIGRLLKDVAVQHRLFAARWGGEEFVLVTTNQKNKVESICMDILTCVHDLQIEHLASKVADTLTVSIGACTDRVSMPEQVRNTVQNADAQLYGVKENGRNDFQTDNHKILTCKC